ncbi:MAG: hypothetical protein IAE97_03285 [Chthoniobacterales bacterium]|nr:hypothetical protein [Chthoniobacterales bacterium]
MCRVSAQQGRGFSAEQAGAALRESLAGIKKHGGYVSLYVYGDSAGVYRTVQKEIIDAGLLFGWEHSTEESIVFTSGDDGASPPPL